MTTRRRFLGDASLLGAALCTDLSAAAPPAVPGLEIHVGSRRQLLFDDFFLGRGSPEKEDSPHGIRWTFGTFQKSLLLLKGGRPWERHVAWVSVLKDGGLYRAWYHNHNPGGD
ncbi:MAG: hypothetical protein NTY38_16175, partial [Acidobacteria bacterium]|nr:hypothetical protein [Acidobacteriota bacterium]